jgi:hypothetical protein
VRVVVRVLVGRSSIATSMPSSIATCSISRRASTSVMAPASRSAMAAKVGRTMDAVISVLARQPWPR